ncbi:hypothetical protein PFISCL1PPCAC_17279, partial [Pristionchus fissidentatus]
ASPGGSAESKGKKRASQELDKGDNGPNSSLPTPAKRSPPEKAKDEFCSDGEEAEQLNVAVKKQKNGIKQLMNLWANEEPYVNVEHPRPSASDRAHCCLYDLREAWSDTRPPPPFPAACADPTLGFGKSGYVRLPFGKNDRLSDGTSTRPRFELIFEALRSFAAGVRNIEHIEAGVGTYFAQFKARNLQKMCDQDEDGVEQLLTNISNIAKIALRSSTLFTGPIPLLTVGGPFKSVSMTQEQAACLLAYGFFCAFGPLPRNIEGTFNFLNFSSFHRGPKPIHLQKLKFILAYFKQVYEKMPTGTLTYSRQAWDSANDERRGYDKWDDPLSDLLVTDEGLIEEMDGCLQVDFANQYIGGGVMNSGAVQEEIRFLCCPEMLVSLLLCQVMQPNEAILIQGAQQFSGYTGYSDSTKYVSMEVRRDEPRDRYGRARSYLIAIDAIRFQNVNSQYRQACITREIKKAYAGYMLVGPDAAARPIATGNWGCGVFNGDKELKSLIQLIAASKAGRPMIYITFKDKQFAMFLSQIYDVLKESGITNGVLFDLLINYKPSMNDGYGVFEYLYHELTI